MSTHATLKLNRRGFTLIELSVVIVILALFAMLVVPNFVAMRRSRAYFDLEASIARTPVDTYNEARSSHRPVQLRIEGSALIMERLTTDSDPQQVKRVDFTSDIQVDRTLLNGDSTDISSWKWTVYPDGSADAGGVEFLVGASRKSLVLHKDGKSQWLSGDLPDATEDKWQAGEIQKRG
ncbi:hypothetical protein LBMAG21_07060 [Armatimonadota bacterium]|nr:hypothetical protein LBMAG21_07060 [Armatimonadota bacterium]